LSKITIDLSDSEYKAISAYAKQCGEKIPDLARKILIRDATLADAQGPTSPEYDVQMRVPSDLGISELEQIEMNYNSNRRILGMKELRL